MITLDEQIKYMESEVKLLELKARVSGWVDVEIPRAILETLKEYKTVLKATGYKL